MELALKIILSLVLIAVVGFVILGVLSQSGEAIGLVDGKLARCPDKPNCVSTEFETDITHYAKPIDFSTDDPSKTLADIKAAIREMGGHIETEENLYLAATFTSSIFRFVDDLEIRIDTDQKRIHLRSASRAGYSDRGINRQRLEKLSAALSKALS